MPQVPQRALPALGGLTPHALSLSPRRSHSPASPDALPGGYSGQARARRPGTLRRSRRLFSQARARARAAMVVAALYAALYWGALDLWPFATPRGFVPRELDVVTVALKPTCVNREALGAVRRYLKPRILHVVTSTERQCSAFRSWGTDITCHLQDEFLPGVTKAGVAEGLARRFQAQGGHRFRGRDLSGWYLQQFIKLGASGALPGLSRYFVVWDADMIPLRPLQLFAVPPRRMGAAVPTQVVVNVGGASPPGYGLAYQTLLGEPLLSAPDGSSFVTHWMMVYQPFVEEFLGTIVGNATGTPPPTVWANAILDALPSSHLDMGFSEYASYISFVRSRHPGSQRLAARKTWLRYGLGGEGAIRMGRALSLHRLCCPSRHALLAARLLGYTYSGLDIGHVPQCGLDAPRHSEAYGVRI